MKHPVLVNLNAILGDFHPFDFCLNQIGSFPPARVNIKICETTTSNNSRGIHGRNQLATITIPLTYHLKLQGEEKVSKIKLGNYGISVHSIYEL